MINKALIRERSESKQARLDEIRIRNSAVVVWVHNCKFTTRLSTIRLDSICPGCGMKENGDIAGHSGGLLS